MISQFFLLTPRGDTIVSKDYRGDAPRGTAEIFFRKLKAWPGGNPPPIFNVEGVHFIHIKRNGLYFVCTTKFNVQPAMLLELLTRITHLCKDYCGLLTEESIRVNFVLVYELLDEVIDFGYGQTTSTEALKAYVHNTPVSVAAPSQSTGFGAMDSKRRSKVMPSSAANKPIALRFQDQKDRKNEIFVDLLERLTVLFGPDGAVMRSEIDGCIQMKSFLNGKPELSVGLNEDIVVGKGPGVYGLVLDDCHFHDCVDVRQFESQRTVTLNPPDGEFTLMRYRMSGGFTANLPFRVSIAVEDVSSTGRTDVIVKLDCDIPPKCHGTNLVIRIPLPKYTTSCGNELGSPAQSFEFKKDDKIGLWKIPKASGGLSYYARLRLMTPDEEKRNVRGDVGNISLDFEIPMHVCSNVAIRFLRVQERGKHYVPFRWVRYITHSDSYVFRV